MADTPEGRSVSRRDLVLLQRQVLQRELPVRVVTSGLGYLLSGLFLPGWVILACIIVHLTFEAIGDRAMRDLDPDAEPLRHALALAAIFIVELAFTAPAALIWHHPSPYAKAFAVGLGTATVMHLSTIRAIYLPIGRAGMAAVTLAAIATNTVFWWQKGEGPLSPVAIFSLLCILGTISYGLGALSSNHELHRTNAQEKARAEAANEAKTRFMAQMSHELRTPLNAILGLGRAELARSTDQTSRERLSVLIASAEGLATLLDDILDVTAVDEGRLPLRPAPTDLRAQLAATVALFRPAAEAAGVALSLDVAPEVPGMAMLDAKRLRQCLTNLLSNALKHTTEGEIVLSASVQAPATGVAAAPMLRIDLTDTGTGIAPDLRERLFQRYVTQDRTGHGRGLGLSISRGLLRQMGGDLALAPLTGAPGTGAHFVLTLPLEPVAPAEASEAGGRDTEGRDMGESASGGSGSGRSGSGGREPATGPDARLHGLRVLVVDDIASNLMVARHMLEQLGCGVSEARSGTAALGLLGQDPAGVVLLDLNMPDMDGTATLAAIRALPGGGNVPVLAMTAETGAAASGHLPDQGFDGFVGKPVEAAILRAELLRVLSARARPDAISG
ncbi:ATP-binding protein [Aliigemmobacter aestuarii]|nr:ATP-binding protein [Gemmobacter aestuarii]